MSQAIPEKALEDAIDDLVFDRYAERKSRPRLSWPRTTLR